MYMAKKCFSSSPSSVLTAPHLLIFSDLNKKTWPHLFLPMSNLKFRYHFMCLTDFNKIILARSIQRLFKINQEHNLYSFLCDAMW